MVSIKAQVAYEHDSKRINQVLWFVVMAALCSIGFWFVPHSRPPSALVNANRFSPMVPALSRVLPPDTVMSLRQPLVLCYHQVRNWIGTDSKTARTYIVPVQQFGDQMKLLHDNGYHTILPDEWNYHLQKGTFLPEKSFLLTFDDGSGSQYSNALPELDLYHFKAVFFIMTVTLDKPGYMSRKQLRCLSDHGHLIGCHTWDHHNVTRYKEADWALQLERPTRLLEQLTGKPVQYFAYPFGSWNTAAIEHLKAQGYCAAFQLGGNADEAELSFTIRRILVDGHWSAPQLMKSITLFDSDKHTRK